MTIYIYYLTIIIITICQMSSDPSSQWFDTYNNKKEPIVKIPLQFYFQPVEIISKELTKLNCSSTYRILYLGPRWENTEALHKNYSKKHGYKFDDKQINNGNTFFSESMCKNQFYRNQVYYRAFQGMNPTIDRQSQLMFDSKFQSGNLDCVVKVAENEYDLFMRVDSNTRGHLFWFYFEVSNAKPGTTLKFNLCNLTKSMQLYEKGFKPYSSVASDNGQFEQWTQGMCQNIQIQRKQMRYKFVYEKIRVRPLYELSFSYVFENKKPIRFAYCIPYTYTQLLNDLKLLPNDPLIKIGSIGKSLTGIDIPVVKVGSISEDCCKKVILIIGRLHPGESNGSHCLNGFIRYLAELPETLYLRKKAIFVIVPMANPDGVILGNSRTGASGRDLNREFKTKNKYLYPQVDKIKKLAYMISETHDIQMFLDFHGHSRKKNMFMFGPNYNITQPQYYRARIMPKFLSQLTQIFRYHGCSYSIPQGKLSTARAVMLNQLAVPYVYTIQTSVGLYYNYDTHKDKPITVKKCEQLGYFILKSILQYLESIDQYEQYILQRKQEVEQLVILQVNHKKISSPLKAKKNRSQKQDSSINKISYNQDDRKKVQAYSSISKDTLKLIKIIEQIKNFEDKKNYRKKEEIMSDVDSDSQNQDDILEKNKMAQFQGMVTQCIHSEKLKKERERQLSGSGKSNNKSITIPKILKNKQKKPESINFMKDLLKDCENNNSKLPVNNHRTSRSFDQPSSYYSPKTVTLKKNQYLKRKQEQILSSQYQQAQESDEKIDQKQTNVNMINMKMFNFSQMIEEAVPRAIMTCGRQRKQRYILNLGQVGEGDSIKDYQTGFETVEVEERADKPGFSSKFCRLSLEPSSLKVPSSQSTKFSQKNNRQKGVFPAPFYRIKYQNYQRKKQRIVEQRQFMREQQIHQKQRTKINSKRKGINFLNITKVGED